MARLTNQPFNRSQTPPPLTSPSGDVTDSRRNMLSRGGVADGQLSVRVTTALDTRRREKTDATNDAAGERRGEAVLGFTSVCKGGGVHQQKESAGSD